MTTNGPSMNGQGEEAGAEWRTSRDRAVQHLCAEVLKTPIGRLRMNKSFLEQGGDSLTAIRLIGRCMDLGYYITVEDIIQSTSLSDLTHKAGNVPVTKSPERRRNGTSSVPTSSISMYTQLAADENADINNTKEHISLMTGLPIDDIEDVYSCTPMQQGLLIHQNISPQLYQCSYVLQISPDSAGTAVDVNRLRLAWDRVIERHDILRTIILEDHMSSGRFNQVVLKRVSSTTVHLQCDETTILSMIESRTPMKFSKLEVPHRLVILEAPSRILYCKLDISHAIVDAASLSVLSRDLWLCYRSEMPLGRGPRFKNYVSYLATASASEEANNYWTQYLANVELCHFPCLSGTPTNNQLETVSFRLTTASEVVQAYCAEHQITLSIACQAAWAMVLRSFCCTDEVCFSYIASGRNVPLAGVDEAIGPFINNLICRIDLPTTTTISEMLQRLKADLTQGMKYQHSAIHELQRLSRGNEQQLCNSMMSFQRNVELEATNISGIEMGLGNVVNPTEVSIRYRQETSS
jgi:hypothetical protein